MITLESVMSISKGDLQKASEGLSQDDIQQLIEWLSLKDDKIRYQAFLLLQNRSKCFGDVYPYWDTFLKKLKSENSYQRSIGIMLIAENINWDTDNRIENAIDSCLQLLNDEKPITIRQCIQSLGKIVSCKPSFNDKISSSLISFNLTAVKETMRKSILLDILNVLLIIRKEFKADKLEGFILNALSGEVLDRKLKKQIEALL